MGELILVSARPDPIKPLVESALANEVRLLEVGLRQTEHRLQLFEDKYQLLTAEFVNRYANDEIEETLETIEWLGEARMAKRIQEKIDRLKEIRFAN